MCTGLLGNGVYLSSQKRLLTEKNYWKACRAGMYACSEGVVCCCFSFRKLMHGVQSDINRFWVRSLMLFAGAESEIKLVIFPKDRN